MAKEKKQALQDAFLNAVRKEKIDLTVFLKNGVKLQGIISWFDSFSVLLKKNNINQLIYKHAISTIMPSQTIKSLEYDSHSESSASSQDAKKEESSDDQKTED